MEKIPTLFARNFTTGLIYNEVVPEAGWVIDGEGEATRKWDGTSCMVKDDKLYRRYDCKPGRTPPEGFIPCEPKPPEDIPHWYMWVPVGPGGNDQYHRAAWGISVFENGTYELCGYKVQGNPANFSPNTHILIRHGADIYPNCPRTFDELQEWFKGRDIEGVVWHHPDGRMAKIKKRDFGMKRSD